MELMIAHKNKSHFSPFLLQASIQQLNYAALFHLHTFAQIFGFTDQ